MRAMALLTLVLAIPAGAQTPVPARPSYSGIYPHLAMFNNEGECGTGAVVPFADRLWVITYAPHMPKGSSDKLYEITADLTQTVRPESIGGTPANRMIHRESNQLFIGPYVIDGERKVRVIPYTQMPGRHTANARHLSDPAGKIYYTTMEEGVYEVDVKTLAAKELFPDGNGTKNKGGDLLPGYHGKGSYSGFGRLIYANNGELSPLAQQRPDIESGVLAEWDGGKDWKIVRRNQFTEVTGPGGIYGNDKPDSDPVWSIGWDHRSLILMMLDGGKWTTYRLPKASHSYDGAHGWNTEWPRIRDIGESDLLMTMHGTFWKFPRTFTAATAAGIRPRSNYLKVVGDFARWGDKIVLGCDDTAKSEFLNKRKAKGNLIGPGQSQSNLWFIDPSRLDDLGPAIGNGAVWLKEDVKAGQWSDPFLFAGYDRRALHLSHGTGEPVTFEFEVDAAGNGAWKALRSVTVPAGGYAWVDFPEAEKAEWIRIRPHGDVVKATAMFHYTNNDPRKAGVVDPMFAAIATPDAKTYSAGLIRARGENKRTLHVAAMQVEGDSVSDVGYYELGVDMKLIKVDDNTAHDYVKKNVAIPKDVLKVEGSSVLYTDDKGRRFRLPKGDAAFDRLTSSGEYRICREVCTERDLFNAHGTFYELPAENAGGFGKVRPVATHNRAIFDYCTYRGLLVLTGIAGAANDPHIIRSEDGKAAVWAGVVDDLWKLGKPVGIGGPWSDSEVKANEPSDPYLFKGYDSRRLTLSQSGKEAVSVRIEIDLTGDGLWTPYKTLEVAPSAKVEHAFPPNFQAAWVRFVADKDTKASAILTYE
ncbi:hypothetical protein IPV69_09975 [Humisphaera borealis]|uniref:Uncharacterized protein n=2 Tax=Humisphaera borealis TaxID=2807512 RepID=A0A7M2X3Y7_9BACT|nr:hypothetical protein IPV69_09975 [Humisphaera borealis]